MNQILTHVGLLDKELVRQWAFHVLQRFADLLGVEEVQKRLKQTRTCYSLFSGIECVRHAWNLITAASIEMWSVDPGMKFEFSVRAFACMLCDSGFRFVIQVHFLANRGQKQPVCPQGGEGQRMPRPDHEVVRR